MRVIFGLTCQSCLHPKISAHGTTTLTYLKSMKKNEQISYLIEKANLNLNNLEILLKKSLETGIRAFRISDSLIPMADLELYDIEK